MHYIPLKMANFPFKSLFQLLQTRSVITKSSKLVKSTVKPVATVAEALKPKTQKPEGEDLSGKEKSVIALLKKQQFSDAQIALLAQRSPKILRCKVKSNLEPKLKFLNESGFEGSVLSEVVVKNPLILRRSLAHLVPNFEYLRELMGDNQPAILFVVKRATWLLTLDLRKILQPNFDLLVEEGVSMSSVLKLFTSQPRTFLCPIDRMRYGIETVKKFGIKPTENMFNHALRAVLSMTESNLTKKMEVLKSLGWSVEDISSTVVRQPLCLSQSEEKLRGAFEFFVNTMRLKPEDIIKFPKLVMYSMNKRIIPRCKVIMALKEKNLMRDLHVPSLINMPEVQFTRKFILKHPTLAASLWILYLGDRKVDDIAVQQ